MGAKAALLSGVSVVNVLMTIRFLVSCIYGTIRACWGAGTKGTHPCRFILTTSDAICPIFAQLQIGNHIIMGSLVVINLVSGLDIEKRDLPRFVASNDDVRCKSERADGGFRSNGVENV